MVYTAGQYTFKEFAVFGAPFQVRPVKAHIDIFNVFIPTHFIR